MKKTLSLFMVAASISFASAQPVATPSWTDTFKAVAETADANTTAPVLLTENGDVYTTGRFNQMIATDKIFLEPVAQDSYLIKYDKNGNVLWNISLAGSATITAIAADTEEDIIYIAGTLADQVTFGTTSSASIVLEGKKDDFGNFVENQLASFIAKYDANGVLIDAKAFVPSTHPDVNQVSEEWGGFYLPEDGAIFTINHMEVEDGRIYVSANYSGQTSIGDLTLKGRLQIYTDFLMIDDTRSAAVISLSAENFNEAELIADFKATDEVATSVIYPQSFTFTVDNGTIYIGAVGRGAMTLTTPAGNENFDFLLSPESSEYGHVIASINGTNKLVKVYKAPANSNESKETINELQISGNTLYVGGVFNDIFAYDNDKTSTNKTDLYVVALDKNTLELQNSWVSGYDEEENNKNQEAFANLLVVDGTIYLNGYREQISDLDVLNGLSYTITNGNITGGSEEGFTTGAGSNSTSMVFIGINANDENDITYYADILSSVEGIKDDIALSAQRVGDTFYFAEPKDITVYDLQGRALQQEYAATSVSIENLSQGIYILSDGKQSLKVLK